jgi:NTP pyrophosphatase (non-canonical NTP hydrolase)
MEHNFNKLTPAQTERLALLSEELGEAIQVIGKILRHGFDSYNPTIPNSPTNTQFLELELGDVVYAMGLMAAAGDVSMDEIEKRVELKVNKHNYFHHQVIS